MRCLHLHRGIPGGGKCIRNIRGSPPRTILLNSCIPYIRIFTYLRVFIFFITNIPSPPPLRCSPRLPPETLTNRHNPNHLINPRSQKPRLLPAPAAAAQTLSTPLSYLHPPLFSPRNSALPSLTTSPKPRPRPILILIMEDTLQQPPTPTRKRRDGKRWRIDYGRCPKNVFRGVPRARWGDRFVGCFVLGKGRWGGRGKSS